MDTIGALKTQEVQSLQESFLTLERKVSQWIHAAPLPVKVSEARLYSVEAQLAREIEARWLLEDNLEMKDTSLSSPRKAAGKGSPQKGSSVIGSSSARVSAVDTPRSSMIQKSVRPKLQRGLSELVRYESLCDR